MATTDADHAMPLGGVILAGGQSRRMGQAKAFLRLAPGGLTLIEQALARLSSVADEVIIVTNTPDLFAHLGARMEGDHFPGLGSLAGIHAGLMASRFEHNLIVACDMPFLEPALLRALAAQPRDYDVLVPRLANGMLETLHAIYSRACLPIITDQLEHGDAKIARFYDWARVRYVDEPELRRYDPDLRSAANLNTPDEFRAAGGVLPDA